MSDWPRVISDVDGDTIEVSPVHGLIEITGILTISNRQTLLAFTVDQCAEVIAAITDAAKVVTGEKA